MEKVKFHFIDQNNNELKIIINSKQNKVLKIPPNIWTILSQFLENH